MSVIRHASDRPGGDERWIADIAAVRAAIADDEVLWRTDEPTIDVGVRDGALVLRGHVRSGLHRARVEEAARRARPGRPVRDELVADDELAVAVAGALARDPRTRALEPRVEAYEGVVHLFGQGDEAMSAAADEVAAAVPGVRAVVSHLPGGPAVPARAVALPPIGAPVEATDGDLGVVELVIVDARFRRVTAMVVRGRRSVPSDLDPEEWPRVPRRLIVPVALVDRRTPAALFVRIDLATADRLPEYRDDEFARPPADWSPPADYERAQVRLTPAALGQPS